MFKDASDEIVDILKNEDVTSNFHEFCVTEKVSLSSLNFFCIFSRDFSKLKSLKIFSESHRLQNRH